MINISYLDYIGNLGNNIQRIYIINIYQLFSEMGDRNFANDIIDILIETKKIEVNEEKILPFDYDDN